MNTESLGRDLAELFEEGAPEVTLEEVKERSPGPVRKVKPSRPVAVAVGAFLAVVVGGLMIGLLTRPSEPTPTSVSPVTAPTTSLDSPDSPEVFVPPTRSADGLSYLSLTLLDGSHVSLAYPSDLDMTSAGVEVATVGSLEGAYSREIGAHYGPPSSFIARMEEHSGPGELAATFPGVNEGVIERWEFPEVPIAYLVYDFDPWTVYVWDGMGGANSPMGEEAQTAWADHLWGGTYAPGFLVLGSEPPLQLVPAADDPGPSGPDIRVDGSSGSLLVFVDDCARMGQTLDEETYGEEVFAFCDEPTNTLFFVGGDAEVQERVHRELVVDPLPPGVSGEEPPTLEQATGSYVYFSTDTQLTVVDIDGGSVEVHDIPELAPGDPPYRLAWRGERLAFYGETDLGRAVMSLDPTDPGFSPTMVKEGAFFIPSAITDRVWAFESNSQGVVTMQELTVEGEATTFEVPTPPGLWPAGAVDRGVLFYGDHDIELWGPDGEGPIQNAPGPHLVAAWQDRLLTCGECDRLNLVYLDVGTMQTVDLPVGVVSVSGSGGSFSPDGRHVAALGFLTPPPITPETEVAVILIDVEAGTTSIVPGSVTTNRFSFPNVAWASDGEWLFIGPVIHEDADQGRLLAYRPGDETAYQVPVGIETEYHGMGAD